MHSEPICVGTCQGLGISSTVPLLHLPPMFRCSPTMHWSGTLSTFNPRASTGSGLDLLGLAVTSAMDSKDTNTQARKVCGTALYYPGPYNLVVAILEFIKMVEITLNDNLPSTLGQ